MLKNTICVTLWLGLMCGLAVTPAQAAKRALVIGNARYTQIGVLPRSEADAQDLARVLRGLGFQVHGGQALLNRSAQVLQKDVEDFQKTIEPGDEVVFYFSGHGVTHEILGNLLVPVDAPALNRLAPPGRLLQQYLGVNDTLKAIADMKPRVLVSILDACRTFPTVKPNGKSDVPSVGLQSTPPPATAGVEQLVMYAAAHGQEALAYLDNGQDRNGRNSVFTRVLLQEMVRPSPSVNQLAYSVAQRVYAMTKTEKDGAQNVEYRSVPTDTPPFSFVPLALAAPVNPPTPSMDSAKDAEIAQLKKQLAERNPPPQAQPPQAQGTPASPNVTSGKASPFPTVLPQVLPQNVTATDIRYHVSDDGSEVKDMQTGLVWQRCSVGQSSNGSTCAGQAKEFTFDEAQKQAVNGWRVPTVRELHSLVWCSSGQTRGQVNPKDGGPLIANSCEGQYQRPTIRSGAFPAMSGNWYWTSSPGVGSSDSAWSVSFVNGGVLNYYRGNHYYVRLVRASQ